HDRLRVVVERRHVEVGDVAATLAARAHAACDGEGTTLDDGLPGLLRLHRSPTRGRGDVERVRLRGTDGRLTQPAEEDPQQGVGVGGRADRGARVAAHALLVDDDGAGESVEDVD